MSRYLLDTNIVIFLMLSELNNISEDIYQILTDYNNQLYTNTIVVTELLQLFKIGKIKSKKYKSADLLYNAIENEFYIEIISFKKQHTKTLSQLYLVRNHNDPFDHAKNTPLYSYFENKTKASSLWEDGRWALTPSPKN